jgi:hypothetical protein
VEPPRNSDTSAQQTFTNNNNNNNNNKFRVVLTGVFVFYLFIL